AVGFGEQFLDRAQLPPRRRGDPSRTHCRQSCGDRNHNNRRAAFYCPPVKFGSAECRSRLVYDRFPHGLVWNQRDLLVLLRTEHFTMGAWLLYSPSRVESTSGFSFASSITRSARFSLSDR